MNALLPIFTLWQRELQRFFRQPSRVAGAIGSPLVFWVLIGVGLSSSFQLPGGAPFGLGAGGAAAGAGGGIDFLRYFYPGTVALVLLFAAIFSTISVIEDRREGFLQGVLAAPVPRSALAAGKVLGGATLAWIQGLIFLPLALFAGIRMSLGEVLAAALAMALLSVTLTALGFAFAWRVDSTQGFHAVMNLVLVPLWLLSGALFPLSGGPPWLVWVMRANPLTYGVAALREAFDPGTIGPASGGVLPGLAVSMAILAATAVLAFLADLVVIRARKIS
jgi:ABC-2 type transport system permease protein